ncbi:hypothetical protein GB937_009737 [Aspergillus fischeri]|nr:hypothetical protein GB937_009737 [Aspergillus fischeri]
MSSCSMSFPWRMIFRGSIRRFRSLIRYRKILFFQSRMRVRANNRVLAPDAGAELVKAIARRWRCLPIIWMVLTRPLWS